MSEYHVTLPDGRQIGPLTTAQMQERLQTGELSADTPCARPGDAEWKPIQSVLAANQASAPVAPTPMRWTDQWPVIIALLVLAGVIVGTYWMNPERQVERVARQALFDHSPRVQKVELATPPSGWDEGKAVYLSGVYARVHFRVSGVNGFNAPTVQTNHVRLEKMDGTWKVIAIREGWYDVPNLNLNGE